MTVNLPQWILRMCRFATSCLLTFAILAFAQCGPSPISTLAAESPSRSLPPLRVAHNHRYLVTADGRPFFWLADTAWELLHRLNREETQHYLEVRAAQGFNVIQTVLIAELDGLNVPNRQGHRPLRDNNPLTPDTQSGPDNDYWDDIDWVLDRATERGFYVALLPTWGEWVTPRFAKETIFATPEQGYAYGRFLGARWKQRSNLVWILGGDRQPTEKPHAMAVWRAMAEGLADGANGAAAFDGNADWSTTLMSYHSMSSSSKWWHPDAWLDFHSWGTYHSKKDWARSFHVARADYALPNPKPTLNAEPCYEAHPMDYRRGNAVFTAAHIRRAAWWSVMSGCLGHTYGADGVWMMSGPPRVQPKVPVPGLKALGDLWPDPPLTWREALDLPGARQLVHLRRFFEQRDFLNYVPDQALLVTAANQPLTEEHAVAGRGKGWAAVYSPMGRAFSLKPDTVGIYGTAAWFNPRDGRAQSVADDTPAATATFTPPSEGDNQDWVLVLEEDSKGVSAPTPSLNYSVSWIGNTFSGGDAGWVPQDVQDICVTPDGTVYTTVGWEEHRGNIAAFKEGALVQQTAHWKRGGIDRLVGETIAANSKHIFFATGKSGPGDHDGKVRGTNLARRDCADIANRKFEKRVEIGVRLLGVAASEDRVYAAGADERVRVFDTDLKPLGDWPAPAPGELAVDASGNLWIIDTRDRVVRRFGPDGERLSQQILLPDGIVPTDVAVTPDQRLLVADSGTNRQVRIYRHLDTTPELERTLGEPGGVFAGPTPGLFGAHRFIAPIGVGGDRDGNVYVACGPYANTHGGTTIIQSYAPDDRLNWRVLSTEWLDTVDVDRATGGTAVYGSKYRYALDLSRPPGRQWSLEAITLHPDRYPDDPRLKSAALGGVWHRWIQGRRYLFSPDMNGGSLFVFRFDPEREGEIAIFCAQISTKELWVDQNGNGGKDAGETAPNPTSETRGWFVEENGTVWQATRTQGIFEHPLTKVLPNGVPAFSADARRSHPMPAPFTELRRIVYDRAADSMYLGGSTGEARAEHWKPMGPNLIRYDAWRGQRRMVWHEVLPHEKAKGGHESHEPFDFAVAGDYVFVVYAGRLPSRNWPTGTVIVLTKPAGRFVGHFEPSGTRTGAVPMDALQDMVHSLNAFRRPNGEYLVFIEDDGYTKNLLYRWQP